MSDMVVPEVDVHQLRDSLADGASLLDVRELDEWLGARVPGVPLIPLAELPAHLDALPPHRGTVYLICHSGARSMHAAEFLKQQGIDATNVAGGTKAWIEAGYEVESGPPGA